MKNFVLCVLALVVFACPSARAAPEKRVALVIGAGHYQNAPELTNPVNDARLIGPALAKLDFQVQTVIDPDYDSMKRALRDFGRQLDGAKVALFFYAGHGMQVAGRNYLVPVNAALAREPDLRYEAFDIEAVLDEMDAPGRVNLVFLDACRDNPLSRSLAAHMGSRSTSVGQGLAETETRASGTLIAYATAPGSIALDGDGGNSPFTSALVRHLATPGLDVRQMLTRVRSDVQSSTSGKQRPWVNENIDADFYFVPQPSQPPPPAPSPGPAGVSPEVVFWQSIAGSTNPGDFEAYIQQFPQGIFLPLARARLASLSARPAPPAAPDDAAWPDEQRRAVQAALTALGHYRGPVNGSFASETRTAILHWQAFVGTDETGHLTAEQRDLVLADAERQAALLRVAAKSPRGTAADSVKGAEARFNRATDFERGDGQPKDPAEAAYWYALSASDGWAAAFTNLGTLYVRGQGVGKADTDAARRLWLTASTLGEGTAMFNLGVLAEKGIGMTADPAAAKRWYARGADRKHAGSAAALQRLGG